MMSILSDLLGRAVTLFAGNGLKLGIAAAAVVMFVTWRNDLKRIGANEVRASIERNTDANAKKADAARRAADKLPADRLCDKYARDC